MVSFKQIISPTFGPVSGAADVLSLIIKIDYENDKNDCYNDNDDDDDGNANCATLFL